MMPSGVEERRPIAVLDAAVVDRIAAGEVIESPESVVRELIDNALDAGAGRVQIEVRNGGLDLIRVADDGHGIAPGEILLAFERHSTSKLRTVEDLASLTTFGYRGEALPSIAAVAEVELASAVDDTGSGRRVLLRRGQVIEQGEAARRRGTTVWVRGLFGALPARLRFLRDARAEITAIARRVRWSAVAEPSVRFELIVDGRVLFRSSGSGRRDQALVEAQGEELARRLAVIEPRQIGPYRLSGLLSASGLTRPSRQHLAVFVNRRRVRSVALEAAVEAGYQGLLPAGRHPVGALFIDVPAAYVDVNVHPSKEQVRLLDEPEVAAALRDAVRATLSASPQEPARLETYTLDTARTAQRRAADGPLLWDMQRRETPTPRYLGQLHAALLVCETRQGLVLVDQHRAHERVIYERLVRAGSKRLVQPLLEPAIIDVPRDREGLIRERLAEMQALGFEYEPFGETAYRIRALPVLLEEREGFELAAEALLLAGERDEFWRDRLLATVACRSAVKKGRALHASQATALIDELFQAAQPTTCPHGAPTVLQLSRALLRRQFRW